MIMKGDDVVKIFKYLCEEIMKIINVGRGQTISSCSLSEVFEETSLTKLCWPKCCWHWPSSVSRQGSQLKLSMDNQGK